MASDLNFILDEDFTDRQLCPDGGCIGVIGADGRCKECGRGADGALVADEAPVSVADEPLAAEAGAIDPDFDDRRLCPDGNCIGLVGDDGHCRICGLAGC
jgi:hypothetical protein